MSALIISVLALYSYPYPTIGFIIGCFGGGYIIKKFQDQSMKCNVNQPNQHRTASEMKMSGLWMFIKYISSIIIGGLCCGIIGAKIGLSLG